MLLLWTHTAWYFCYELTLHGTSVMISHYMVLLLWHTLHGTSVMNSHYMVLLLWTHTAWYFCYKLTLPGTSGINSHCLVLLMSVYELTLPGSSGLTFLTNSIIVSGTRMWRSIRNTILFWSWIVSTAVWIAFVLWNLPKFLTVRMLGKWFLEKKITAI